MVQSYCSTVKQRVQCVSEVLAEEGSYGVVTQVSRSSGVSRQTLYNWKAKGQAALEEVLTPARPQPAACQQIERAVLTRLLEGHASYRGIQRCVESLLGEHVSLGTIVAVVQRAGERAQQAARLANGERPREAHPQTDVAAHAALLAQAQYLASSLRYLSEELRRLVEAVVLAPNADGGVLSSQVRDGELETVLAMLDEISQQAPAAVHQDVTTLATHLRAALPHLVLFAPDLDAVQDHALA